MDKGNDLNLCFVFADPNELVDKFVPLYQCQKSGTDSKFISVETKTTVDEISEFDCLT